MQTGLFSLILSCLLYATASYPQGKSILLNNLTIQNGLSSGSVTCVLQDSEGFIWIGTEDGLNKFDGYQTQVYRHNVLMTNSIGGNSVRTLFEDSRKNLWIGLKGAGLSRMNLKTGKITTYRNTNDPNSLSYNDVAGLVEDEEGNLWIAVDRGGLDMFDYEKEIFKHYNVQEKPNSDLLNNAFTGILLDKQGQLWLSSWGGGVFRFDLKTKKFIVPDFWQHEEVADEKVCHHIFNLYNDSENNIWVSSAHGGLYKIDLSRKLYKQFTPCNNGNGCITTRSVRSVCEDEQGMLWIATDGGGINVFDKEAEKVVRVIRRKEHGKSLLTNNVFSIYRDKMNMMWLGTGMGVNYFNPSAVQFDWYMKSTNGGLSLSENQVMSVLKDKQGNLWIGGINSLDKIDRSRTDITRYQTDNLMYRDAFRHNQALCEDSEGNIWIGAYSEYLLKYNPAIDKFTKIEIPSNSGHMLPYSNVYSIYEDTDKTLWLATELGTLNYNPKTEVFTPLFFSKSIIYPEEKSHVVYRDKDMDFWVGTEGGLRRYTKDLKSHIVYKVEEDVANGLTNNFITTLLEDVNKNFWVGTYGGLHRFDKTTDRFELVTRHDKRFDEPILGLCEDKSGNLWISIVTGIMKFNPKTGKFHLYDQSDGLQDKDFYLGACFQASDGELFFGGKNGFNSFYPETLKTNTIQPKVLITDLLIFNQPVEPSEKGILTRPISETNSIRLKHSESVITFRFVALNYISPQKNKYAYRLEGFDKDWILSDATQRTATYTNLPAGDYIFKVKASNNDGIWNDEGAQIKLKVLPPFWRSWVAYLLYFSFVLFVMFLIVRYFSVRERDRIQLEIAQIEAQRIKEIDQMKINVFTNVSHEFRTPLSLILTPLNQILEKKAYPDEDEPLYKLMHRNAQRLLRLINQLLDFRKIEEKKLELTLQYDDVLKHIKDTAMSFQFLASDKKIQYMIQSDQSEIWTKFDADKMDKILYNLISNAFNYTPEEGKVLVSVSKVEANGDNPKLRIEVTDTGVGIADADMQRLFTLFFQGDTQKSVYSGGSGIGLALTKQLVELHKGEISVKSQLNEGTTFTVILPIIGNNEMIIKTSAEELFGVETKTDDEQPSPADERRGLDVVLVVEDNYDMRMYIRNILAGQFKIILAKDGKEGLDKAVEHIPDLIVSDIMMPVMDGIAMTQTLRNDDRTSHIPIILLTSLQSEAQVVEGYQLGVEDYVTKPFSVAILQARIQNILHSRKKIWEKYRQSFDMEEYQEKMAEDPKKQAFVNKINEVILNHIADPDFGVESLANELIMSVNQLSRKVKALMDTTPYNVIVQVRMTHAAKLLKESDKNISEVAFAVGYHELSNFSRAFKNYFYKSPREYMRG